MRDYIELTKPRITAMVLVTAALGFYLAAGGFAPAATFWVAMLGTALAASGASALNQCLERDVDARMQRTRNRPLPAGRIPATAALYFGAVLTVGGCLLLVWYVNLLAAFLTLLSAFLYVLVYTPLKRLTWLNTSVGAIPGAMPPLIGWAAANATLDPTAWVLFGVLFIWQHPHFFAIAWMYREDYARGGLKMLPVVKPDGRNMFRQTIAFSLLLLPVSAVLVWTGHAGMLYLAGALALGLFMVFRSWVFRREQSIGAARRVLRASLVYLPVLLLLIILDAQL